MKKEETTTKKMVSIKQLIQDQEENIMSDAVDYVDGTQDGYICDSISEWADSMTDVYTYDLEKWADMEDGEEWIQEAIAQGLIDTSEYDHDKWLMTAQYLYHSQKMYEEEEEIQRLYVYKYVDAQGVEEVTEKQAEQLSDIAEYSNANRWEDLQAEAEDIIHSEDEEDEDTGGTE